MTMMPVTLEQIARVTGGTFVGDEGEKHTRITGVEKDNRQIEKGNLFVCIQGERVDGHSFAQAAFAAGAACCLAEKPVEGGPYVLVDSTLEAIKALAAYYRSLFSIPVVGIIGSVGKTPAKEMTAAVLGEKFRVLKTEGNLNNELGVPLMLLKLRQEHTAAVIEMGISDFGEMSRLGAMVRPTAVVMTTIGYCHLENLGDLDGVLRAKSEVFAFMDGGTAVVNGDDEKLAAMDPGREKITFGIGPDNDYRAENVTAQGTACVELDVAYPKGRFHVSVPAFGSHIPLAVLPAAAIGHRLGMTDEEIRRGILNYAVVGGRAHVIDTGYIRILDDCYNANPNSVTAALLSLSALSGRKVAILGDMKELGRDSESFHREIGVLAGKCAVDALICCGDEANSYYKGLIASGSEILAWHFPMKDALLSVLPRLIRKGDNVLVKASHSMHFEEITRELEKLK
jgi:UDP-N-acetylmuramoyl-tripeptide--D-alanyl-D-alanine ligase